MGTLQTCRSFIRKPKAALKNCQCNNHHNKPVGRQTFSLSWGCLKPSLSGLCVISSCLMWVAAVLPDSWAGAQLAGKETVGCGQGPGSWGAGGPSRLHTTFWCDPTWVSPGFIGQGPYRTEAVMEECGENTDADTSCFGTLMRKWPNC